VALVEDVQVACLDMNQAFTLRRGHARNTNQRLTDLARHFINSSSADFPPSQ
jgi:hypothetical protein